MRHIEVTITTRRSHTKPLNYIQFNGIWKGFDLHFSIPFRILLDSTRIVHACMFTLVSFVSQQWNIDLNKSTVCLSVKVICEPFEGKEWKRNLAGRRLYNNNKCVSVYVFLS